MIDKLKTPFISSEETLKYILRTVFTSKDCSPQILSDATGVDIDLCIEFCAANFANLFCSDKENFKTTIKK